jgi:hypothetical protein
MLTEEGEQIGVDRTEFDRRLSALPVIHFQWWRDVSHDVYCRIRRIPDRTIIDFGMDGMDDDEEQEFIQCVLSLTRHSVAARTALGLVVDRTGDCTEFGDWDAFFLGKGKTGNVRPTILGVGARDRKRVSVWPAWSRTEVIDDFVLFYA